MNRAASLAAWRQRPDVTCRRPSRIVCTSSAEQVVAVAVGVAPFLLGRMGQPAVDLHAELERLVEVVEVPDSAGEIAADLALGGRQAVRALDVSHVAELERRHGPVGRGGQRFDQPGSTAHPLAGGEGGGQHPGTDQIAADGARQPGKGGIDGGRGLDEVKDGLRDRRARQLPGRKGARWPRASTGE